VLVRCHAGCDQRDGIAALKECGLWDGKDRTSLREIVSPQGVAC
jgi:putative DNA primase/helicase